MKEFKIIKISKRGSKKESIRTLEEHEQAFGYTLQIAYEAGKIKKKSGFKTPNQFFNALCKAYDYREACCYDRTILTMELL